ncbi:MAG: hypothetical protein Q8Q33_01735 [Chlamydiota bacterium]|nr:hypothetical protein [Chlamydiota bacterium]
MKRTFMLTLFITLLVLCGNPKLLNAEETVEFTFSNYTGDYALRVVQILPAAGTVSQDDITGQRLDDGDTKALYVKSSSSDNEDQITLGIVFEVIGNPSVCGTDNEKCSFTINYSDSIVNAIQDIGHLDSPSDTRYTIEPGPNCVFNIKNAGNFTKDDHPWCKIHIEK